MYINHLPNEIITEILKLLKDKEVNDSALAQCALTCKQWRQPAQEVLYSTITINSMQKLDEMMDTHHELGNYVHSINYCMNFCELSLFKIASLFKNLVRLNCPQSSDHLIKCILRLLKTGSFPALETIPSPISGSQENYNACFEIMKDRLTEINLVIQGEESGSYFSMHKELELFSRLHTIKMDYPDDKNCMVWKDFDAVSATVCVKTLNIHPNSLIDFSFDTTIIPKPDVETLNIINPDFLNNSFMQYVINTLTRLKRLNVMYYGSYRGRGLTRTSELVPFLKHLYSLQTATGIFVQLSVAELPKLLLSLLELLDKKQLQDTTFTLDLGGGFFSR